jgi:hypothetical protein
LLQLEFICLQFCHTELEKQELHGWEIESSFLNFIPTYQIKHPFWKLEPAPSTMVSPTSASPVRRPTTAFMDAHVPTRLPSHNYHIPCLLSAPTQLPPEATPSLQHQGEPLRRLFFMSFCLVLPVERWQHVFVDVCIHMKSC